MTTKKEKVPSVSQTTLSARSHDVHTNELVRIPREERSAIGTPRQTSAVWLPVAWDLLLPFKLLWDEGIHNRLGLQIPNLDTFIRGRAEPIPVGAEYERMDDLPGIETVETLALVEIP